MIRLKAVVHAIQPVRSNQFLNLNWTLGCEIETRFGNIATIQSNNRFLTLSWTLGREIETRFGNIATIQHNDKKIEDIVMHKKARFSIVCHFSGTLMVSVKLCISASGLCTSMLIMIEKYFSAFNCLKRVGTDDCHKATHY